MNWPKIVLIALYALAMFTTIASVGKEKKPTTPGVAALSTAITIGLIALVVIA